jgi:glycosyltransferase involved in cell wall biosynthesis
VKIVYLVHQFYPKHVSGTEKFIYNMATCAQRQGHKVAVVTYAFKEDLRDAKKDGNLLTEKYMYRGIPVVSFGHENGSDDVHYRVEDEDLGRFASRLLSEEAPDIIHAGHPMRIFEILGNAKERRIPYIVTLTDFWAICFKGILLDSGLNLCTGPKDGQECVRNCQELPYEMIRMRLDATKGILMGARAVCAPTQFLAALYMNEIPALDVKVIPLGLRMAKAIDKKRKLRKGDRVTFIFGGTWLPHKGLHVLLEALSGVRSSNIVLKVYGAGGSMEYNDLISNFAKKDKRIKIMGAFREDEFDSILAEADCSVVPSIWWENSPYMLLEALARNVPTIVADVEGLTEYVKDDFNGFTFSPGDMLHLREVIERIAKDPSLLNTIRENLRKYVLQTVEQEAYAYERLYSGAA